MFMHMGMVHYQFRAHLQVPLSEDEKKAAEQSTETTAGTAAYQVSRLP